MTDKQGQPHYFISQIVDVTESKAALARQRELTLKAQAGEQAKSDFLATMSHEIRTPLNGVIGMASILADTELNEMQRECVETINSSGESLLAVINDILDYSKIEAGRLEMERRPFNLYQSVEEAFHLFASQIRAKNLEAVYFVSPEIPADLVGDPMRLRQVLLNLIGNAIKFTSRGEVVVNVALQGTDEAGCRLHFSVSDTGVGIPADVIGNLFTAFRQGDTSTTRRYGGTGLGLAICKRLTTLMGGSIWAESTVGAGSTFHFSVVLEPAAADSVAEPNASAAQLTSRSALVVDDHAKSRRFLELQLSYWGMAVTTASSGSQALDILGRETFDVALVDAHMPGMDGLTLAHRIRRAWPVPMVLLSTAGEAADAEEGLFHADIAKPIKHSMLLQALLKVAGTQAEVARPAARKLDHELGTKHPLRILLAEDNKVNQKVGLLMLSRLGYQAEAVDNGRKVLEALEAAAYDVVLMGHPDAGDERRRGDAVAHASGSARRAGDRCADGGGAGGRRGAAAGQRLRSLREQAVAGPDAAADPAGNRGRAVGSPGRVVIKRRRVTPGFSLPGQSVRSLHWSQPGVSAPGHDEFSTLTITGQTLES